MLLPVSERARAWLYAGQWVADCPQPSCSNVELLFDSAGRRRPVFRCTYCHRIAEIEWADDEAAILAVLGRRPVPHTRNWFPPRHDLALRAGLPHGQSPAELLAENLEHGVM